MSKKNQHFDPYEERESEDTFRKHQKKKLLQKASYLDDDMLDDIDYTAYKFLRSMED